MCSEIYFENDLETRVNTLENNKIMILVCNVKKKKYINSPSVSAWLCLSDMLKELINSK